MNSDFWFVAQDIRQYLIENPNNHLLFIRAQSYSILQAAMTLTGIDMRSLNAEELNFALNLSKITDDLDIFYLAEAMYTCNKYDHDNALLLLERSSELNCTLLCMSILGIQSLKSVYPTINQAKTAVKIARLMYDTFE